MGFPIYKSTQTPCIGDELDTAIEPSNLMNKYAVAMFQEEGAKLMGYLPLGKSDKVEKIIFHFLKADKRSLCQVIVRGRAVNQDDGKRMKVLCCLLFTAENRYMVALKERKQFIRFQYHFLVLEEKHLNAFLQREKKLRKAKYDF